MEDKEIVKALEIFVNSVGKGFVFANVDIKKDGVNEFKHIDLSFDEIFDLINRLQAENERLRGHQKDGFFNLLGNCLVFSKTLEDYNDMRKGLKAEAIKEFVERLKERADKLKHISIDGKWAISQYDVDKLLKEKVGSDLF